MTHKTRVLTLFCILFVLFAGMVCASEFRSSNMGHDSLGYEVNPLYGEKPSDFVSAVVALVGEEGMEEEIPVPDKYTDSIREAADLLRGAMTERTNRIVLGYQSPSDTDLGVLAREIFNVALLHSGLPTEGDYLVWQWKDRMIDIWWEERDGACFVIISYVINYYTTADMENELSLEVERVLDALDLYAASDYEKIRGIYDYICTNVRYDYAHVNQPSYTLQYTAYGALMNKTAVCQGYAVLFYRLASELGLDSRIIFGTSQNTNHTWLIVRLGDTYFNIDPTWDEGRASYLWFLKGEANFPDHRRGDNALCGMYYTSSAFYAAYPVATWDFSSHAAPKEEMRGVCGEDLSWILGEDGRLVIFGTGAMWDYDLSAAPWKENAAFVREIVVAEGVTSIGASAFSLCTEVGTVALPDSVTDVGSNAFGEAAFYYPERVPVTLPLDFPYLLASSPNGSRCLITEGEGMDILSLVSMFDTKSSDRLQVVSADGSDRYTGTDVVPLGAKIQRLDKNGGVTDEITVVLRGDFNLDGTVEEEDAAILLWSFMLPQKYGEVPQYDLNGDGLVNPSDAAYVYTRADE